MALCISYEQWGHKSFESHKILDIKKNVNCVMLLMYPELNLSSLVVVVAPHFVDYAS